VSLPVQSKIGLNSLTKHFTLKNFVLAVVMGFLFYGLKKSISDIVLNFDSCIITLPSELSASLISLSLKLPLKGLIEDLSDKVEQDILFKNSDGDGEGSDTGEPSGSGVNLGDSGEPSGSGGPTGSDQVPYNKVITDSDFESPTDSEGEGNSPLPSDDPFEGKKSMAIIYGNEEHIKSSTKEELKDAIKTIEQMKEMHREMPVPASDSEIKRLTKKEELCLEELEKRNSEGEKESTIKGPEDKGKGPEDKGKGKEKSN
jgi:hypothetical protein